MATIEEIENGRTAQATRTDLTDAVVTAALYVFSPRENHAQALVNLRAALTDLDTYNNLAQDRQRNRRRQARNHE